MMYIPKHLHASREEVENIEETNTITLDDIVRVHYCYFHDTADFDGGLSLFNALKRSLSKFYDSVHSWDIEDMKKQIREAENPQHAYMAMLDGILTEDMIYCYGY